MPSASIPLHPEFGLNPSLTLCFYCLETNAIALLGNHCETEAPRVIGIIDMNPCAKCEEHMQSGIICIGVDDGQLEALQAEQTEYRNACPPPKQPFIPNPSRTGLFCVIKEEDFERVFTGPAADSARKVRWAFLEQSVVDQIGLVAPEEEEGDTPDDTEPG